MKYSKLLLASLCLGAAASYAADARFYAQPSIAIAEVEGFDSAVGGGLAAGFLFANKHAVELDFAQFSVEDSDTDASFVDEFNYDFAPVLLNYRYEFPITAKLYGSIGASLGVTFQDVSVRQTYSSPFFGSGVIEFKRKDEAFTMGYSAGIGYRFNDHAAAVLSARSLRASKSDVFPDNTYSLLQLGLNWRF
jgi:hypothetical protein